MEYLEYMTPEIIDKAMSSKVFYWDWEISLLHWFQGIHSNVLDKIMTLITHCGDEGIFWIALTVLLLLIPKTRKLGGASFIALCFSVLFTNIILKHAFIRCRPCWLPYLIGDEAQGWMTQIKYLVSFPDDYSFPSGHTSASLASAIALFGSLKKGRKRWGVLAIVFAILIAISRLYVCVHWPTDVIVGAIVGIIAGIIGCLLMKVINDFIMKHEIPLAYPLLKKANEDK